MATWIFAIDATAGIAGWVEMIKARNASLVFNESANYLPVYTMDYVLFTSIAEMVSKIIVAADGDKISRLILFGHAKSGMQSFGCGHSVNVNNTTDDFLAVDPSSGTLKNKAAAELALLTPYLAPGARVSLAGCFVAWPREGQRLLSRISTILGNVTVEGGIGLQTSLFPGYEGPVLRCNGNSCSTIPWPVERIAIGVN